MICCQSMYRTFNEFAGLNVQFFSCFFHFFLKVPGDGAGEMYRCLLKIVLHHISSEEITETSNQQGMDFGFLPMSGEERSKTRQKTVGLRLAIYLVDDFCRSELGLFQKGLANVFRKLVLQAIAHKPFP